MEFVGGSRVGSDLDAQRKELRKQLDALSAQRSVLEAEAGAIHDELTSPGANGERPAGVKDPLVDEEGFPRADIDIFRVRHLRHRLAEINYDHKALMKRIEALLQDIFSLMPLPDSTSSQAVSDSSAKAAAVEPEASTSTPTTSTSDLDAFAVLDQVLADSPTFLAGVRNGDRLLRFGEVQSTTPSPLQAIARLVGESVHKSIPIFVKRGNEILQLVLIPQPWGGRGLLGCHLSPL